MALTLLGVFVGGGLGAVSRYGVTLAALRLVPGYFPWGTLAVNVAGCFVLGLLMPLFATRADLSPALKAGLTTGFLGGLTTFSTFGHETVGLFAGGRAGLGVANLLGNLVVGLGASGLGLWLGAKLA